jgi:hypothetical protein
VRLAANGVTSRIARHRLRETSSALEPVSPQGYYTLRKELPFEGGSWPKGSIVQLGYTAKAIPKEELVLPGPDFIDRPLPP